MSHHPTESEIADIVETVRTSLRRGLTVTVNVHGKYSDDNDAVTAVLDLPERTVNDKAYGAYEVWETKGYTSGITRLCFFPNHRERAVEDTRHDVLQPIRRHSYDAGIL